MAKEGEGRWVPLGSREEGFNRRQWLGGARRYEDTETGAVISRRQFENQRAKEAGFSSWADYQSLSTGRTEKSREYLTDLVDAADRTGKSYRELRSFDSDFNQAYGRLQEEGRRDTRPGSALADYLVAIGRRDRDSRYNVGDTPKTGRR